MSFHFDDNRHKGPLGVWNFPVFYGVGLVRLFSSELVEYISILDGMIGVGYGILM
jgi:hypothetical protein